MNASFKIALVCALAWLAAALISSRQIQTESSTDAKTGKHIKPSIQSSGRKEVAENTKIRISGEGFQNLLKTASPSDLYNYSVEVNSSDEYLQIVMAIPPGDDWDRWRGSFITEWAIKFPSGLFDSMGRLNAAERRAAIIFLAAWGDEATVVKMPEMVPSDEYGVFLNNVGLNHPERLVKLPFPEGVDKRRLFLMHLAGEMANRQLLADLSRIISDKSVSDWMKSPSDWRVVGSTIARGNGTFAERLSRMNSLQMSDQTVAKEVFSSFFEQSLQRNPNEVLPAIQEIKDPALRDNAIYAAALQLSRTDPYEAREWSKKIISEDLRQNLDLLLK